MTQIQKVIKALQIFEKYDANAGINCDHDVMYVCTSASDTTIDKDEVLELIDLGFDYDDDSEYWTSNQSC